MIFPQQNTKQPPTRKLQDKKTTLSRNGFREGRMKRDEVSPSQVQDSVLLGSGGKPQGCNQKSALNPLHRPAKHALAESQRLAFFPHGKKQAWFERIAWLSPLRLAACLFSCGLRLFARTKGLSGRPLEPFGYLYFFVEFSCCNGFWSVAFFLRLDFVCHNQGAFRSPLGTLRIPLLSCWIFVL